MAKTRVVTSREMLFYLANRFCHVWAPCDVSEADLAHDPDVTPEENAAVHCLQTYGMASTPKAVRDQHGKLVTRGAK